MIDLQHTSELESIYANLTQQSIKQLAICSLLNNSGNSTLALSLAKRGASSARRVLLIEFNTVRPILHTLKSVEHREWLPVNQQWRQGIQLSTEPNLSILVTPKESAYNVEFHDLDTIKTFLTQVSEVYDLVICDCAPLLDNSPHQIPASMICSACEHSIINLLTNINTESQLEETRDILLSCNANLAGVVMNDQFAPSLKDELLRESQRLNRFMPNLMSKLRRKLRHSDLLNQDL